MLLAARALLGEAASGKRLVGTVTAVSAETGELQFKPDNAAPLTVRAPAAIPASEIGAALLRSFANGATRSIRVAGISLAGFGPFGTSTTYNRKIDAQLRFSF
jgi:hypothetical protein